MTKETIIMTTNNNNNNKVDDSTPTSTKLQDKVDISIDDDEKEEAETEGIERKLSSKERGIPPSLSPKKKEKKNDEIISLSDYGSLYHDAMQATLSSSYIFSVVKLRRMAKQAMKSNNYNNGSIEKDDCIELLKDFKTFPMNNLTVKRLTDKYKSHLQRFRDNDFMDLQNVVFQDQPINQLNTKFIEIYYVSDELEQDECVYVISRNEFRKQINLTFRGSITLTDWYHDFKLVISQIPNPVTHGLQEAIHSRNNTKTGNKDKEEEEKEGSDDRVTTPAPPSAGPVVRDNKDFMELPDKIGLHLGFKTYMHGHDTKTTLLKSFEKMGVPSINTSMITQPIKAAGKKIKTSVDENVLKTSNTSSSIKESKKGSSSSNNNHQNVEPQSSEQQSSTTMVDVDEVTTTTTGTSQKKEQQSQSQPSQQSKDGTGMKEGSSGKEESKEKVKDDKDDGNKKTKVETILEQLHYLKSKFPNDCIVVNGHSLGGALSLISSLAIASDPVLGAPLPNENQGSKVPVRCVVIANPKPGDRNFVKTMKYLEQHKRIQICCFHNYLDIVPITPPNYTKTDGGFWHPGFRVLMYKHHFELGRGDSHKPLIGQVVYGCCGLATKFGWNVEQEERMVIKSASSSKGMISKRRVNLHNYREYLQRLLNQKEQISKLSLNGLYDKVWHDDE